MVYCTGLRSTRSYGGYEVTDGIYKLSVAVWIFLGLASFASVVATLQDTYAAIVWRVEDKAVKLKEMAGKGGENRKSCNVSAGSSRVAPSDSDGQAKPDIDDVDNSHNDHIQIT